MSHRTHCKRGHERTEENIYVESRSGARLCRVCRNERKREWAKSHRPAPAEREPRTRKAPATAPERPIDVGQPVWLVRDGVRSRMRVVGYRGTVALLKAAS